MKTLLTAIPFDSAGGPSIVSTRPTSRPMPRSSRTPRQRLILLGLASLIGLTPTVLNAQAGGGGAGEGSGSSGSGSAASTTSGTTTTTGDSSSGTSVKSTVTNQEDAANDSSMTGDTSTDGSDEAASTTSATTTANAEANPSVPPANTEGGPVVSDSQIRFKADVRQQSTLPEQELVPAGGGTPNPPSGSIPEDSIPPGSIPDDQPAPGSVPESSTPSNSTSSTTVMPGNTPTQTTPTQTDPEYPFDDPPIIVP